MLVSRTHKSDVEEKTFLRRWTLQASHQKTQALESYQEKTNKLYTHAL